MSKTDLSKYNNDWYAPTIGASSIKQALWYFINAIFFTTNLFPFSRLKVFLLRLFGARIGRAVVVKPAVNIKYPWKLIVGDYTWIGENVWIDNLTDTRIGSHVCISQGAFLLTGNHDYTTTAFNLIVKPINIEDGAWIGAGAMVCPGVTCGTHSVLSVRSVAVKDLDSYSIYRGNPAEKVRDRSINTV